ncbi:hypothetical protein [Paenibacillus sp. Pae108]|uniref:hypothetical protein n=2 Tax=Paenibacillus TaxID=44249 RepID=UPI0021180AAE|nr:hypothetical protein [Paenibacillus sp. Pae108]
MTLKCGRRDVGILAMEFWQAGGGYCWHERKLVEESKLAECFAILENGLRTERDIACFEALKAAWRQFSIIKDQIAQWMLEGEFEKAKQALANHGRERFKQAVDLVVEWMEH